MANNDRDRRAKAGLMLLAKVAAAGGKVFASEMARLAKEAGYLDGRGWPAYLNGKPPLLARDGAMIVLTKRGFEELGSAVLRLLRRR